MKRRAGAIVSTIAVLSAVPVWLWLGSMALGGDLAAGFPGGSTALVALAIASCILDVGAARLIIVGRARNATLGYLAVRFILALGGVSFLALPSYSIALAALAVASGPRPADGPPHAFVAPDSTGPGATFASRLFASDWSQDVRGGSDGPLCTVCGKPSWAPVHRIETA